MSTTSATVAELAAATEQRSVHTANASPTWRVTTRGEERDDLVTAIYEAERALRVAERALQRAERVLADA